MAKVTRMNIPVLVGFNYEHVMAYAVMVEEGDEVTITINAKDNNARDLIGLLSSNEIKAISFTAVPVQPRNQNLKEII